MSTTLDAVAVGHGGRWSHRDARKLADEAAERCLAEAGVAPNDVDLLISTGIYHDRSLGEPALAALVQEDIGANPTEPPDGRHGTFSFDVADGTCGVLTALQVADRFLAAGTIRRALVVAGDADPGHRGAVDFPFDPTAAAALLGRGDAPGPSLRVRWADAPDEGLFQSTLGLEGGRNVLRIWEHPQYLARAAAWATTVATDLLVAEGLTTDDVDLVVAAPFTAAFTHQLEQDLGIGGDRLVQPAGSLRTHTAGLLVAIDRARRDGRWDAARRVLLVSAGAGLTAGAALLGGDG